MAKKRFQLDPNESAQENLWRAVRIATYVVLKRKNYYGLINETRDELVDEVMLETYEGFIRNKVLAHKYNRKFCFLDNVLSSCWSCAHKTADRIIRQLDFVVKSEDVHSPYHQDTLPSQAGFPVYLSKKEMCTYKPVGMKEARMDVKVKRILEEYEEQRDDAIELGVTPMKFEAWLVATGYSKDADVMLWLHPDESERKKWAAQIQRREEPGEFPHTWAQPYKRRQRV